MSGGNTTTQTQTSEPWKEATPYLKEALQGSQNAYRSGTGFDYFPGSTVTPFANQTTQAMSGIQGLATQGDPLNQSAMNQAQGVLNSSGMSDWQRQALGGTFDVATGATGLGTEGDYRGLLSRAGNPYYEQLVNAEAGKLAGDVNRGFSNSGRYGSAAHTGALVDQIGDFRNKALSDQYNQGIAAERGLLGDITGVQGANISNMVGAGGQINQAGNQAIGNIAQFSGLAPSLYQQQYAPYERLASVGSQYEDLATRQMQDSINRFNTNQQAPWNSVAAYNALASGAGQLGGSSTATAMGPRNYMSPVGGALGGAQMGSAFGPWGTALGGGLGGLFGLLGM